MDTISITLRRMLASFLTFLPDLIVALLIFIASVYLAGFISKIVKATLQKRKVDNEITLLVVQVTRWGVIIFGTFAALQQVGFNATAFLTGLGILGFTVGFALQDVSKNFVAGLLLLLEQPFDIGDTIEVSGFSGTVANVELRATEIYTFDGQNVLIPNADVFTKPIKNFSRFSQRRFDFSVGVAYDSDLKLVRQTVMEVITAIPGFLPEKSPAVVFNNLGPSTIDFTVYFWVDLKIGDYLETIDRTITGIHAAFAQNGIEMPFPTQTIRLEK